MTTRYKIIIALLLLACASFAIGRLYSHSLGFCVGVPALVISGWRFFGHLVTIDDEAPGSFSNPESSSRIWHNSLLEALAKAVLFTVVCALVLAGQ
jgi:hypothetical protein